MFPYICLMGIPIIMRIIDRKFVITNKRFNPVITSFFVIFFLLLIFRGSYIGNDTIAYENSYRMSEYNSWVSVLNFDAEWEIGYSFIQKLFCELGISFRVFLTFVTFIAIYPIWYFYNKEAEVPYLSFALFVTIAPFSMYFSGLRQIVAMAFAFPAFYFAKKKNLFGFVVMLLLAMLFHRSSFVMLLIYPICQVQLSAKKLWVVIPIVGLVWNFKEYIFNTLTDFVRDTYTVKIEQTGAYTVFFILIALAIYCYTVPDEDELDRTTILLRNLLVVSICFQSFSSLNSLAMRLNYYYLPFVPVLICKIANRSKKNIFQIVWVTVAAMIIILTVYFFYRMKQGGGLNIYPYKTFFG